MEVLFLSHKDQYLEHDLYCKISSNMPAFVKTVYLYSDWGSESTRINLSRKKESFDEIIQLPFPVLKASLRNISGVFVWFRYLFDLRRWKKQFLATIDSLNNPAVVLLSSSTVNSMMLLKERPNLTVFFLQSCNTKKHYKTSLSLKDRVRIFFYNQILGVPVKSKGSGPWSRSKVDHYLLWSNRWFRGSDSLLKDHRIKETGFPLNDDLYSNFIPNRVIPEKARVLILLNKEFSMGLDNWMLYQEFYAKLIEEYPQHDFYIKPHPLGDKRLVQESFPGVLQLKSINWGEVDLMINHWSSATVSSIIAGVPTILINPNGRFDFEERFLDHYSAIATNHEEFGLLISRFSERPENFQIAREEFLLESFSTLSPTATQKVTDTILKSVE